MVRRLAAEHDADLRRAVAAEREVGARQREEAVRRLLAERDADAGRRDTELRRALGEQQQQQQQRDAELRRLASERDDDVRRLAAESVRHEADAQRLAAEVNRLRADAAAALERLRAAERDGAALEEELARARQQRDKLAGELQAALETGVEARRERQELQQQLRTARDDADAEVARLASAAAARQSEVARLTERLQTGDTKFKEQVSVLAENNMQLDSKVTEMQSQLTQAEQKCEAAEKALRDTVDCVAASFSQFPPTLKRSLLMLPIAAGYGASSADTSVSSASAAAAAVATLASLKSFFSQLITDNNRTVERLQRQLDGANSQVRLLQEKLSVLERKQAELTTQANRAVELEAKLRAFHSKTQVFLTKVTDKDREIAALQGQLEHACTDQLTLEGLLASSHLDNKIERRIQDHLNMPASMTSQTKRPPSAERRTQT
eukprot:TRINITY_DN200_c0_g1_i7.p2 TRINITY_DN200_c0_g1~~TRINITY_DN200_c0_g1_i7.p2  ORF type:complete len:439 (+),score=135.39 TRINITY_DN200_c0_g1_i7:1432-2748(+)